jgi:hypothetical protein
MDATVFFKAADGVHKVRLPASKPPLTIEHQAEPVRIDAAE